MMPDAVSDRSQFLAIIGAGPVGLALAKALQNLDVPYEQLEADDDVGGNWYHGVYETAHIISSKKTTEFSDFPMPADYPDFPSRHQMYEYLRAYADHFNLRPRIQFKTKVIMARPLRDERWELELATGEKRIYKGLLICNGHHWARRFPNYPGRFAGEFIHSKDYKRPEQVAGKRVLVIGGGNSACDVASEAARVGACSHISLRRGYWFLPKTVCGVPLVEFIRGWMPVPAQRLLLRAMLRVVFGKYERYGLPQPEHKIFETHPTINGELLHYVKHGRIAPKPDIARFDGHRVEFADGTGAEYDLVICATGYHVSFPFLPAGLVPVKGSIAQLYGGCMLPDYKNLYVIGTSQPRYGFGPLATIGADLVARMIKMQDQMELPLGLVLKESGEKVPTTHLVDPHAAMRRMKRARLTLPLLLRAERRLREKQQNDPPTSNWPAQSDVDLQVY
ncbi:MAG TPA: NAD(P)-binding domain-containing protein [Blastocatellia bacterium]|nr:NAD(P)-binding domain-containing protein [Blastocatellia bacterium]